MAKRRKEGKKEGKKKKEKKERRKKERKKHTIHDTMVYNRCILGVWIRRRWQAGRRYAAHLVQGGHVIFVYLLCFFSCFCFVFCFLFSRTGYA